MSSWTDRILWRDQGDLITNHGYHSSMQQIESDHKPVCAMFCIKVYLFISFFHYFVLIDAKNKLKVLKIKLSRQLDVFENEAIPTIKLSDSSINFGAVGFPQPKIRQVMLVNIGKVWSKVSCIIQIPDSEWLSIKPTSCFLFPGIYGITRF